jgi:hypothetical protein
VIRLTGRTTRQRLLPAALAAGRTSPALDQATAEFLHLNQRDDLGGYSTRKEGFARGGELTCAAQTGHQVSNQGVTHRTYMAS